MNKKIYVKPMTDIIIMDNEDFICLSWGVKDNDDKNEYIRPPVVAGSGEWSEENSGNKTDIWGDLD